MRGEVCARYAAKTDDESEDFLRKRALRKLALSMVEIFFEFVPRFAMRF